MLEKTGLFWIWTIVLALLAAATGHLGWGVHALWTTEYPVYVKPPPAKMMWLTCQELGWDTHRNFCKPSNGIDDADTPRQ